MVMVTKKQIWMRRIKRNSIWILLALIAVLCVVGMFSGAKSEPVVKTLAITHAEFYDRINTSAESLASSLNEERILDLKFHTMFLKEREETNFFTQVIDDYIVITGDVDKETDEILKLEVLMMLDKVTTDEKKGLNTTTFMSLLVKSLENQMTNPALDDILRAVNFTGKEKVEEMKGETTANKKVYKLDSYENTLRFIIKPI